MPFTLAHPMAVLPFPRNRYFHFPALVLGSMSPDFIYFLSGKATQGGHQLFYSEWLNLPLCLLLFGIYRLLERAIKDYSPSFITSQVPQRYFQQPLIWLVAFIYSAWLGMASHILLDNFTHQTGYFVVQYPFLQKIYFSLPLYKWLQYTGGILGLLIIFFYQWRMARKYPYPSPKTAKQKWGFWLIQLSLTLLGLAIWHQLSAIQFNQYATLVIRFIDCWLISLCLLCSTIKILRIM